MYRKPALVVTGIILILALTQCFTSRPAVTGDPSGRYPSAIREFRAAWVATVANISWPSKPGLTVEEQKQEAIELLDLLHDNNFNAVVFQVRPHCDALYDSELEPWSYYLTGQQGIAPEPYYDPLEFWIDEAHKRGIELHAWLNPYRAHHVAGGPLTEQSIVRKKPGLALFLEQGYWWLDPSKQGTQDHSYNVVMDLVRRYDLDGIHFDDYFYPYPDYNNFKDFPDDESWAAYREAGGKLDRGDWRRKSVNDFIQRVYKGIKSEKPYVKFGLSPFGIWRPYNPPFVSGFDQHEVLYADARKWLNEGWIDYYSPQLYWPIDREGQSYPILLGWWASENKKDRHLWPGINIGRLEGDEGIDETIDQIMITRGMVPDSPGVIHWSINPLVYNPLLAKAISEGPYKKEALVPPSPWLSKKMPEPPIVNIVTGDDSIGISWGHINKENISRWVLYSKYGPSWAYTIFNKDINVKSIPLFEVDKEALFNIDPDTEYEASDIIKPLDSIAVSAVDRYGNESQVLSKEIDALAIADAPDPEKLRESYIASLPATVNNTAEEEYPEVKEYFIPPEVLSASEKEKVKSEISESIQQAMREGANSIFMEVNKSDTDESDVWKYAIEKAHDNNLKFFFVIAPLKNPDPVWDKPFPRIKTDLKKDIQSYVNSYDIDGLGFEFHDYNMKDGHSDKNLLADLLEDAVVEAMLIKPYLMTSVINKDGIVSPYRIRKVKPQQIIGLNFSRFYSEDHAGQPVYIKAEGRTKITDEDGSIGFITDISDTVQIETEQGNLSLPTKYWSVPYNYAVFAGDSVARIKPWVEFRRMPPSITYAPEFDLLCKTDYPSRAMINNEEVKQYKTGIFFKTIILKEGSNRVRASIVTNDSLSAIYEQEFIYKKSDLTREAYPLWIDGSSISPAYETEILQDDIVMFSFTGSLGQEAQIKVIPGNLEIECSATDYDDYSIYRADIPGHRLDPGRKYNILIRLSDAGSKPEHDPIEKLSPYSFFVRHPDDFPLIKVSRENGRLTYNLGSPRLGGPLRSEPAAGTVFKVNGIFRDKYRVRLSAVEEGFIDINDVEVLPEGTVMPSYHVTNMSCSPSAGGDILAIPYAEPVPWEIHPDPENSRIIITMYGVRTSSTWVSHSSGLSIIDRITWEQTTPETFRVYVNLNTSKIWGYDAGISGSRLVLRVKYPPVIKPLKNKPLKGLKIAIEAGHGGQNTGAIGLSGLLEKDINLDLSFRLEKLCRNLGAEVIQIRDADIDMSLYEKRDSAISSGADMLISIHANAGGRGYLSVDGTSTYYHNPYWAPLAEVIYDRLLELGLDEFGVVGSFNYTVTRMTQMPAVLVEQAFLSHAEDEEKLADPEFRQRIAEKIAEGIVDYIK